VSDIPIEEEVREALNRAYRPAPELLSVSIAAIRNDRPQHFRQPWGVALIAAVLAVAIVATLVIGSRRLGPVPSQRNNLPSPRAAASIAYDEVSGQLVLFGGTTNGQASGFVNETWTWNGRVWTLQHPPTSPSVRTGAPMAYDPLHHVVVMFGGSGRAQVGKGGQIILTDTWTWDGRTWTQKQTSSAPTAVDTSVDSRSMAFDPVSRRILYYTAQTGPRTPGRTWAWTGSDWQELHPTTQPVTFQGSLVTAGRRLLLIAQPTAPEGGRYLTGTWTWDGSDWKRLNPQVNLPATGVFAAAFDETNSRIVAFNGDTWTFDGSTWSRQHTTSAPSRRLPYVAYLRTLGKVVAWGDRFSGQIGDLWAWDGSSWSRLQAGPAVPPPPTPMNFGFQNGSPAEAESSIRKTVSFPVLLPSSLPPGLEASYSATVDAFTVGYSTFQRDQLISLDSRGGTPPPSFAQTSHRQLTFRGLTASYHVLDATSPPSKRWLIWTESGSHYLLTTEGLTDQEFWQVANSLR
jgi:hypothetical protein